MHDDGPQVILPAPALSPEKGAARLQEAEAILGDAGLAGAVPEDHGETLIIRLADAAHLIRLQDGAFRGALVARLSALGFPYVAVDLALDGPEGSSSADAA